MTFEQYLSQRAQRRAQFLRSAKERGLDIDAMRLKRLEAMVKRMRPAIVQGEQIYFAVRIKLNKQRTTLVWDKDFGCLITAYRGPKCFKK